MCYLCRSLYLVRCTVNIINSYIFVCVNCIISDYFFISVIVGSRFVFFFFKQKTAYEMRISDWSSDVCSSDLSRRHSFCGLQRAAILADTAFDFRAEMLDQPLDRPCGGVAERTDGVAFDLLGDVEQSVDLADVGVAGAQDRTGVV